MSRAALEEILSRAIEDERFRERLLRVPLEALTGYDLSDEERDAVVAGNLTELLRSLDRTRNGRA